MGSWSSAITRLRRLAEFSPSQIVTLGVAAVSLRVVPLLLRRKGLQEVQAMLVRRGRGRAATPARWPDAAADLSHLVGVASRFGPAKPNCLARSVVLWWLLGRRGIDSEIRIGVRRRAQGEGLDFHAWVERGGEVLNDAADIRSRFATFDRAIVPRAASFDR